MIYFVGAGPGDKDLITVKGKGLLEKADVIIYAGSLVNETLLEYRKEDCQIYNSASMTLEEVIEVMLIGEERNALIVRLHTGDPSIYGAIREQMDLLDEQAIAYEVVPGVSSFCGAAAALKAEYTLPGVSQTVILTRMEGRTPVPHLEDLELLAHHQSTMVLFLSASLLEAASQKLIAGGYDKKTPAAIVYKASWPDEKVFHTTIEDLTQTAKENKITKTALITIGNFLGNTYERSDLYNPAFTHEYRKAKK